MTVTLGPLVVDAVEPRAVEGFWAAALGEPAQRALLKFRPQTRAKTVKNRCIWTSMSAASSGSWI